MKRPAVTPVWRPRPQPDPADIAALAADRRLPPSIAALAITRARAAGLADDAFVGGRLSDLEPPLRFPGMADAMAVLVPAVRDRRRIAVFGDYDVDGITGTTLLVRMLRESGLSDAFGVVPNRKDGYGLTESAVRHLARRGAEVVITVDNGIAAPDAVRAALAAGIAVVVTDHHAFDPGNLPPAPCVHPGLGDAGSWANASGSGVAFALAIALRAALRESGWYADHPEPRLVELGVLAALGTVADMVPLVGANRILVRDAVGRLSRAPWPGLQALIASSKVRQFDEETFSFILGPRINAAGRVHDAMTALDLLLTDDPAAAARGAAAIEGLNVERKRIEQQILREVEQQIAGDPGFSERSLIFGAHPKWPHGVLGIVAAKVMRRHHRPAILMQIDGDEAKGSGRAIPEVDLLAALEEARTLTTAMGGHRASAGMTVPLRHLGEFRRLVEAALDRQGGVAAWSPVLELDGLIALSELRPELLGALDELRPFGVGNPRPLFISEGFVPRSLTVQRGGHLRFQVPAPGAPVSAIMFDGGHRPPPSGPIRIAFAPRRDAWSGRENGIELHVEDLQPAPFG